MHWNLSPSALYAHALARGEGKLVHMGAFAAACAERVPVVPAGIAGTRAILRGDSAFARPGKIHVIVGPPARPQGDDWAAALALRDMTRAAILPICGEPDLIGEPTAI